MYFVHRIGLPAVYCPSWRQHQPFQCIQLHRIHLETSSTPLNFNMHVNPSSPSIPCFALKWSMQLSVYTAVALKLTHAHVDPGQLSLCQPGPCWFHKVRHCDSHQSVDTRWHRTVETQHKNYDWWCLTCDLTSTKITLSVSSSLKSRRIPHFLSAKS